MVADGGKCFSHKRLILRSFIYIMSEIKNFTSATNNHNSITTISIASKTLVGVGDRPSILLSMLSLMHFLASIFVHTPKSGSWSINISSYEFIYVIFILVYSLFHFLLFVDSRYN